MMSIIEVRAKFAKAYASQGIARLLRSTPYWLGRGLWYFLKIRLDPGSHLARISCRLLSPDFSREQQAVLAGLQLYHAHQASSTLDNEALLRRCIHMIEKGITMRPRRSVFALDYIATTLAVYEKRLSRYKGYEDDTLIWAHDVLMSYFRLTTNHPVVDPLRQRFAQLAEPRRNGNVERAPFARDLAQPSPVAYDDLLALAIRRRSVRWFLQQPVPRNLVEKAMAVALQSPTACNRQPFVFRFFDDPQMVKSVAEVPPGTGGYGHNIPMIAVVVGQQRNFFNERDRHLIYIDGALAAMSFCFALETLGLSSCVINWPDVEERERRMAKLIGLEPDERPVMLIGLGYPDPDALVPYSGKKPISSVVVYE